MRHVCGPSRNRRRSAANSAVAKIAHMAITPQAEKGVGDVKRSASITSGGLVIQRPPTWNDHRADQQAADPAMYAPPAMDRQSR